MLILLISCANNAKSEVSNNNNTSQIEKEDITSLSNKNEIDEKAPIIVAANRTEKYVPLLKDKKVGIVTNKSGLIFKEAIHSEKESTHIVDSLIARNVNIARVFSPEHGLEEM